MTDKAKIEVALVVLDVHIELEESHASTSHLLSNESKGAIADIHSKFTIKRMEDIGRILRGER